MVKPKTCMETIYILFSFIYKFMPKIDWSFLFVEQIFLYFQRFYFLKQIFVFWQMENCWLYLLSIWWKLYYFWNCYEYIQVLILYKLLRNCRHILSVSFVYLGSIMIWTLRRYHAGCSPYSFGFDSWLMIYFWEPELLW